MKTKAIILFAALVPVFAQAEEKQIKALLLTGGGYHDYENQKTILTEGLSERVNFKWTIIHQDADATKALLKESGWADGFDVVVYNICHAGETDAEYVKSITDLHAKGLPAVVIHCTLHSYHWRTNSDDWVRFIGVTSPRHGKQSPIHVKTVKTDHPIMKGQPEEWSTPAGELYHVDKVWDSATVLADGHIDGVDGKHAVFWVNEFGDGRVFGTSIGHHNETMGEKTFLDLVARGTLWATGKLKDDGTVEDGYAVK